MRRSAVLLARLAAATALAALLASCLEPSTSGGGEPSPVPEDVGVPLAKVTLLAPGPRGGGAVPIFVWAPLPGASSYRLSVHSPGGTILWAWEGSESRVALGGGSSPRPPGLPGPVILTGCSWRVAALDSHQGVVGLSDERRVDP